MKTIVILSHVGNDSPYCSYVHCHAKALAKNSKVIVFAFNNYFPFIRNKIEKRVEMIDGVEVHYNNRISFSNLLINSKININGFLYYLLAKKEIREILKSTSIDLIDAHSYKVEGYAAYLLKRVFNIKTVVTLHGTSFTNSYNNKKGQAETKKIGSLIDYFVCVSDKLERCLKTINVNNTKVIYNGINMNLLKRTNMPYHIVTVANLVKCKNIDILIEAFAEAKKSNDALMLTIIGDGPLMKSYVSLIENLNLGDSIQLLGHLENEKVFEELSQSDLFILPSSPEGFGICYAEAMYCGCITIGTLGEGIDGFIKNGKNGFLIKPVKEEIFKIINNIYAGKYELEKIRKNGIIDASKLTWEDNAERYLEL